MRATNHQNSNQTTAVTGAKASGKCRTAFKVTSTACVAMLAAAAMVVPTTTLAPGVVAQTDSRVASYSIGDISKFSGCITKNCTQSVIVPKAEVTKAVPNTTVAIPAVTVQPTAAQAATKAATTAATKPKSKATATSATPTAAQTTKAAGRPVAEASGSRTQTRKQYDIVSYDYDSYDDEDYGYSYYSYDDNDDYDDSYSYSYDDDYDDDGGYSYDDQYSYSGDYNDDDDSSAAPSTTQAESSRSYSSNALIAVANPDYSYSPRHVSLSSYDRSKLERLVMGEAGTMGYTGCAVVAQAIRDSMNRSNTSSIDRIISEYQYFGSTDVAPNADVKAAVSFIFDQDGIAVQHRVMCFYIGYSPWHETQTFLTEIDGVRFFDLNVA